MKNKSGKGARPLLPAMTILDPRGEYVPSGPRSWLAGVFGLDDDTRLCQARATASEVFLQTQLFPLVESGANIDEATIVDLLIDFKQSRGERAVEFEMAQVMARMLSRFQCHLLDETEGAPSVVSESLEREVDLFTALAGLDFQRIDEAVRERLHSG
jgi:hypothetical protein